VIDTGGLVVSLAVNDLSVSDLLSEFQVAIALPLLLVLVLTDDPVQSNGAGLCLPVPRLGGGHIQVGRAGRLDCQRLIEVNRAYCRGLGNGLSV
jgi:hypothetical protein